MKEEKNTAPIEVRDLRTKQFFMMDDAYLNGWAKVCGWQATLVYLSLCRHANKEQKSWPSIDLIADENGISRNTVKKGLKALVAHNIVNITKGKTREGKYANNIYLLVDKKRWTKDQGPVKDADHVPVEASDKRYHQGPVVTKPRPSRDKNQGPVEASKETQLKETHRRRVHAKKVNTAYLEELQKKYRIDVYFEWDKARDWMSANGRKYKDERAFFRNWLRNSGRYGNTRPLAPKQMNLEEKTITDEDRKKGKAIIDAARKKLGISSSRLFGP